MLSDLERGTARAADAPEAPAAGCMLLGDWIFDLPARQLRRGEVVVALEPKQVAVLAMLCRRPGEVIDSQTVLDTCWPGEALGDNPIHKVIALLRRALGDSATKPTYLETIRQRGYRLIAPVRVLSATTGERSLARGWRGQSPFCGLEPFGPSHASVFFGRDDAVESLRERIARQWERGWPLVLLLGPSGCGKTSLVHAGLIPALSSPSRRDASLRICSTAVADLGMTDESGPWPALAGALLDWEVAGTPLLSGYSIDSLATALRVAPGSVLHQIGIGLDSAGAHASVAPPLLVLDRLEALLQPSVAVVAQDFVDCIDRLVGSRRMVVLALCRNDFYPALAAHPALMRDKDRGAHLDLAPPGREAIAQIIRLPARAAGLVYGSDESGLNRLDDVLCADAMQTCDALPLLQYTLQELYLQRGPGDELTWATYGAIGGLEGAIGQRAEATLSALPASRQEALVRILPRLVGLASNDSAPTGRWVADASLEGDDERALVRALVDARLLVADHLRGQPGYRVAHEALLRRWPRVTAWLGQHRATLALRDEILPWTQRWVDGARASALLLPPGALLWQSRDAVAGSPGLFGTDEHAFVDRSLARDRRQARRRWIAGAGVVALAIVALLAAWRSAQLADTASARARQSQRLASFMLGELADQLRPIGRLDLLSRIGEQSLQVLSPAGGGHDESPGDVLQRARALVVIGETNSSRAQVHTGLAVRALEDASRMLKSIEHAPGIAADDYYRTLGASAFWRGQIAFDAGEMAQATVEMSRYREACERWLAAVPGDAGARTELSFALNSLGSIAVQRAAWIEAQHWLETSLTLKRSLLSLHPDDAQAQDAVASSRVWLGLVAHVRGDQVRALALLDDALEIQRRLLTQHHDELTRVADLGATLMRRAEVLRDLGRAQDAARAMGESVAMLDNAAAGDPRNQHWAEERMHASAALVLARLEAGDSPDGSLRALRSAASIPRKASAAPSMARALTGLLLQAIDGEIARRGADWNAVLAATGEGDRQLALLQAQRPHQWQLTELQARFGALRLQALAATARDAERVASCRSLANALQPAVELGQAGTVLATWHSAKACAAAGDPGSVLARVDATRATPP